MGLFGPARSERTAAEVREGQRAERLKDANASTRPNTVTVDELKNRGR